MGLGVRKSINRIYIRFLILKFDIRKIFFGFENALKLFITMDKRAVIPILRKYGASIGENCDIETPLIFHNSLDFKKLIIGNNCHIGKNCFLDLRNGIEIGDGVTISMQSSIITHLDVGRSALIKKFPPSSEKIKIEDNVYIGAGTTILMAVTLKENSFVAAGSLVNKNVESNTLVGGVPAKVIKKL